MIQWQEIRERLRLNKIYEGLRVKDDRPRYIFDGKSRDYYRRFHPNKKTKAIFPPLGSVRTKDGILIPGLKTLYRPIMGGSPDTYYVRQGGTAANKEAASGPGSDASACMSVTTHNDEGDVYSPGDVFKVCDDGGIIRGSLNPPSSGSEASPIIYQAENGDTPSIRGSSIMSGFTEYQPDKWRVVMSDVVGQAFFDGVRGTEEVSIEALNSEYEWYWWDSGPGYLVVYSTEDPDTAYTTVEINHIAYPLNCAQDYIIFENIDLGYAKDHNFTISGNNCILQNFNSSYAAQYGGTFNGNGIIVDDITFHHNGDLSTHHGLYPGASADDYIIQNCIAHTNEGGVGIHCYNTGGGIVRYNLNYNNGTAGMIVWLIAADKHVDCCYNIAYGNGSDGFIIRQNNSGVTVNFYNNTSYSNTSNGLNIEDNDSVSNNAIVIKNNILVGNTAVDLLHRDGVGEYLLDYNCYYRASGNMITFDGNTYTQAQFAAYQAAESQDANGISADPLFVDAPNYDFTLQSTSPCINAGEDVGLTQDFVGTTVPQGSAPDIGAYEYFIISGGTLRSVRIVTASELKVNGGRFTLQQGPAIKVRGYKLVEAGATKIKGGDAQPIYILADTDIKSGGGRWKVNAGPVILVTDVIGDERGIIQGNAIPVYPVDDDGNFDPTFAI